MTLSLFSSQLPANNFIYVTHSPPCKISLMASLRATSSHLLASQLPDPNDTQDYGSDFNDEELEELNREVDRIYGKQPTPAIEIEDNPITNDVEYLPTNASVARVPHSSQPQLSQRIEVELQDDSERISDGNREKVTYPDRKSLPCRPSSCNNRALLTPAYSV